MAKRPNILKLATKISLESMTYMGITYDDPEYKILEPIIDDDMCAIMMHVRLETNRTVEEVAKRARKSVEFTQEQLDKLCKTGAVRYRYVDGKRCYFYPIWVPGIMEGILANREQCDKYPVLGESFEAYTRRRPEMLAPMLDSGKTGMFFMRVMPVMSAIENDSHAASYDEVRTLIENATRHQRSVRAPPPCPPSHGRGLRPPRRGYVHVPQRQRPLLLRAGLSPPRDQGRGV